MDHTDRMDHDDIGGIGGIGDDRALSHRITPAPPVPGSDPVTAVHFGEPLAFSHQFAESG